MYQVEKIDGEARTGSLVLPDGKIISTPAMLVYTRRGGALNLTPDLLQTLQPDAQALQLNVLSFIGSTTTIQSFPGSAREFLAIDKNFAIVASHRDPCMYEYQGPQRQATNDAVSFSSYGGANTVTPEQYMATAAALQPDVVVVLSDEVPHDAKRTRAGASTERTLSWLSRCLTALQSTSFSFKNSNSLPPAVFACVQGGQFLDYRERCTAGVLAVLPNLAGVCIGGLGTGESPQQRAEIIQLVLKDVPAEKTRMVSGVGTPEEILSSVGQGVDLFDLSFIADVTAGGYALHFPVEPPTNGDDGAEERTNSCSTGSGDGDAGDVAAMQGLEDTKMNLWAAAYRADARPLVANCSCLACSSLHSRAYIHHLLQSHEMTAHVLLEAHNTLHYLRFFAAVRRAVAAGQFAAYREWFLGRKQRWMMGDSVVGKEL